MMELLITISILSIVFLAMLSILPTAMMTIRQSEHRLAAGALIGAVTENLLAGDYTQLLANDGTFDAASSGAVGDLLKRLDDSTNDAAVLRVEVRIAGLTPTYPRTQLCEVVVSCNWTEKNGDQTMVRKMRVANVTR